MVEQLNRNQHVGGSSPLAGSNMRRNTDQAVIVSISRQRIDRSKRGAVFLYKNLPLDLVKREHLSFLGRLLFKMLQQEKEK